jgi:hypothetical protein
MVSWAHTNTDWDQNQVAKWEQVVKEFAELLRACGVDANLDLWHLSETSIDWSRWGQDKVRTSEFVIVVLNEAWKQRWAEPICGRHGAADRLFGKAGQRSGLTISSARACAISVANLSIDLGQATKVGLHQLSSVEGEQNDSPGVGEQQQT